MYSKKAWIISLIVLSVLIAVLISFIFRGKTSPNIIFIVIDALRSDHLGCYGYQRNTTPYIDTLAENGLIFKNCIAQSPWTLSSMASIFTSRYPSQIGVGAVADKNGMRNLYQNIPSALQEEELTLAEVFTENEYHTLSIAPNYFVSEKFGLSQGFEEGFYTRHKNAEQVVDLAIEQLRGNLKKKIFLYLHFMDVHVPTNPPPPYSTLYSTLDNKPHNRNHYEWSYKKGESLDTQEFREYKSHKIALYDGALNFIDAQINRLMEFIQNSPLEGNNIIIISSDHGEEFWDHALFEKKNYEDPRGYYGIDHGHTMFRELLDVPLIMYGKGVPKNSIHQQVRNLDIMPSLIGLSNTKKINSRMEGIDIVKKVKKNKLKDLVAISEDISYGYEKKSLQDHEYKYISGEVELFFHKTKDPLEKTNIIENKPDLAVQYNKTLHNFFDTIKHHKRESVKKDKELIEELRSLGYIK
jgi:arylsulfatase A-like enzyme